jgi:hypothetical protein
VLVPLPLYTTVPWFAPVPNVFPVEYAVPPVGSVRVAFFAYRTIITLCPGVFFVHDSPCRPPAAPVGAVGVAGVGFGIAFTVKCAFPVFSPAGGHADESVHVPSPPASPGIASAAAGPPDVRCPCAMM